MSKTQRMMSRRVFAAVSWAAFVVTMVVFSQRAGADVRKFAWTYEAKLIPAGWTELEFYQAVTVPDNTMPGINTWRYQLELEQGLTEWVDVSLYQLFSQANTQTGGSLVYDGFKLRLRFLTGSRDWWITPVLYTEVRVPGKFSNPSELEGKVLLSKTAGGWTFAYNQIIKQETRREAGARHSYAAGIAYSFSRVFGVGLESRGEFTSGTAAVGPVAHLLTKRFFVTAGLLSAVNEKTPDVQVQTIFGFLLE